MLLTQKLLRFLNRVFDKDPGRFLALRLSYDGIMTWSVQDAVLRTQVTGGAGVSLEVDLSDYTIDGLVSFLVAQPGYDVLFADTSERSQLSARVLMDGAGDIAASNGDHLYGYTNALWAFLESAANELNRARAQIAQMLLQMSTRTAGDIWLDELGGYYGIPRLVGELDQQYGPRIIAEVLRPRGNNVAMEMAIKVFTGQDTTVSDVLDWTPDFPVYNGAIDYDGTQTHDSGATPSYCLFDVEYGYDLENGGDFADFQQVITDLINRLRDAGTHLRSLSLVGSELRDTFTAPTDGALTLHASMAVDDTLTEPTEAFASRVRMAPLVDAPPDPVTDEASLNITSNIVYGGLRRFNGAVTFRGDLETSEAI